MTGGYSYSKSHGEFPSLNESNLSTSLLGPNGIPAAQTVRNTLNIQESKLISFFGRANYNLNDHYLASLASGATGRRGSEPATPGATSRRLPSRGACRRNRS